MHVYSYVTGNISSNLKTMNGNLGANTTLYSGGFAGFVRGGANISNSYVSGNVLSDVYAAVRDTTGYSGGLIGQALADSKTVNVSNSYVIGSVITDNATGRNSAVGGIIGLLGSWYNIEDKADASILNSYTSVLVSGSRYSGGAVGYVTGSNSSNRSNVHIQIFAALGSVSGDRDYTDGIANLARYAYITTSSAYYNSSNNSSDYGNGIEESKFTADNMQIIGFTDANGWMYTGSSATPTLKPLVNTINAETTLRELLGEGCNAQTIVIQTSSGTKNIVISAFDSIVDKLDEAGIEVTIEDGKVNLEGDRNRILSVSAELSNALHLVGVDDGSSSGSGSGIEGTTKPVELTSSEAVMVDYEDSGSWTEGPLFIDDETELGSMGVSTTNYITVQNGSTIETISVDNTVDWSYNQGGGGLVERLHDVGITTYVTNGKVTFVGDDTHYILGMTANLRVALNMESGVGYTVIPNQTSGGETSGGGSSGGSSTYISTIYISSSASNVALSSVGVNSTNYITVKNGSTTSTVTVDASTTVSQLAAALAGVGITTDVTNGKFTFSGDDTHYILGITTQPTSRAP